MLRQWAFAYTKECCKKEQIRKIDIRLIQSDDINEVVKSPNWAPSYDWEETIGDEGSEGFYVWHNKCFCIKEVYIDYYRKPLDIQTPKAMVGGSYTDATGKKITKNIGLELDSTYQKDFIVELAAAYFFKDMGDDSELKSMLELINYKEGYLIKN